jgi:Flp pilus assembly pilin Flp
MRSIVKFLKNEEAATAVEYSVMLAMILLVAFAAISGFGGKTRGL